MKKSKVTLFLGGKRESYSVEYDSLESLCESVFDLICQKRVSLDKTVLTLDDGTSYIWNATMAHYCFAKGRISVAEFIEYQFSKSQTL